MRYHPSGTDRIPSRNLGHHTGFSRIPRLQIPGTCRSRGDHDSARDDRATQAARGVHMEEKVKPATSIWRRERRCSFGALRRTRGQLWWCRMMKENGRRLEETRLREAIINLSRRGWSPVRVLRPSLQVTFSKARKDPVPDRGCARPRVRYGQGQLAENACRRYER